MPPAPWDGASSADQLFVLVTGANSGIGLGICQRLIDEFVAAHPGPGAHLVLIVTTRSPSKARATRVALRQHLARRVAAAARKTHTGTPTGLHPGRIHVAGLELDLCCLPSVYAAADRLVHGTVDVFSGIDDGPQHNNDNSFVSASIPRLDSVVLNAGIGGFTGMHWGRFAWNVLTAGFVQATTYPQFKMAQRGLRVDPLTGRYVSAAADAHEQPEEGLEDRTLGAVFCANVFGHYVLVHALLPLLRRTTVDDHHDVLPPPPPPPARVIWESSVESVCWRYLAPDDLQGLRTDAPYESSKRLTDVLALTADLPGVAGVAKAYWEEATGGEGADTGAKTEKTPTTTPTLLLSHPGVVCSTLFPLSFLLYYCYVAAMYAARWLGSPWHAVTAYKGAAAAVWLVLLQPPATLAALDAPHAKWGTATTRGGRTLAKRTEVEGWGWRGRVGEETRACDDPDDEDNNTLLEQVPILGHAVGRRRGGTPLTAERRQEFEALGRDCWRAMEQLRVEWDGRVKAAAAAAPATATATASNGTTKTHGKA